MNDYQKTELAARKLTFETLLALATAVVEAMGAPWRVEEPKLKLTDPDVWCRYPSDIVILGDNGESFDFLFQSNTKQQRLYIRGNYPRTAKGEYISFPYGVESPSITVAANKTPKQIAADILRRFVPDYRQLLAQIVERKNSTDTYDAKVAENRKLLAQAFGCSLKDNGQGDNANLHFYSSKTAHGCYGEIWVSSDSCELKLRSVPISTALAIAELLRTGAHNNQED